MVGDGGGKVPGIAGSVFGADNVARGLARLSSMLARIDARVQPHEMNAQPGAILRDRDGKVVSTLTLALLAPGSSLGTFTNTAFKLIMAEVRASTTTLRHASSQAAAKLESAAGPTKRRTRSRSTRWPRSPM
jgi:hypothetical protein